MGEIPHLKTLVQRHKDDPFALVGVNTDRSKDDYLQKAEDYGVTWRSSFEGSTEGKWPTEWGISSYPSVIVLDAEHRIRHWGLRGERLGKAVQELLDEMKVAQSE